MRPPGDPGRHDRHPPRRTAYSASKAAPAALEVDAPDPATGVVAVDEESGVVEAIAAVTAIRDEVGDVIEVGARAKSLRRQTPRLCVAHQWPRIAGRITSAVELMPGDPRLPTTGPDGQSWPREAGALLIKARYILGTREGREAFEVAKAFDTDMAYSIGYRVPGRRGEDPGRGPLHL